MFFFTFELSFKKTVFLDKRIVLSNGVPFARLDSDNITFLFFPQNRTKSPTVHLILQYPKHIVFSHRFATINGCGGVFVTTQAT